MSTMTCCTRRMDPSINPSIEFIYSLHVVYIGVNVVQKGLSIHDRNLRQYWAMVNEHMLDESWNTLCNAWQHTNTMGSIGWSFFFNRMI